MKPERFTAGIFIFVISALMLSAAFSFAANKVKGLTEKQKPESEIKTDWEKLYPFTDGKKQQTPSEKKSLIEHAKQKLEDYTSKNLPGYYRLTEAAKKYEDIIGWNMVSVYEYNPVMILDDGYLAPFVPSRDISAHAASAISLADFCAGMGIDFFYVNEPGKICSHEDSNISGILDFSNQNADRFLKKLEVSGVKCYDLRKYLHDEGRNHHGMFFATDHHWKPKTGLWAAGHILRILHDNYGWPASHENIRPEKFSYAAYHDLFLGALGKKMTLSRARPEDFTVIYPENNIHLNLELPDEGINLSGDFSVFYDMKNIASGDYYGKDTYITYCWGTRPMLRARRTDGGRKKLFLIRNSFASTIIPFLSLEIKDVSAVDLRYLRGMADGSIRRYIAEERPDAVIMIYHASVPGRVAEVDQRLWDFN